MKQFILSIIFSSIFVTGFSQQEAAYTRTMETNIKTLDTASTTETYVQLGNNFDRIANAAKDQWLPYYYAGFCYAVMAFKTKDKTQVDAIADKADSYLDKADALKPGNSEISTLRAMITNTRILVDPRSRWQELNTVSEGWIIKAQQQDPANPRPWYIQARTKLYTPAMLGGGPEAALPVLEEALTRFGKFQPDNSLAPNWGHEEAQKLLTQLKK
ncbi:MAG: hypothetical protein J7578_18240 [Chitinophagaceae bacterium]|nr:hypothetical protein [Chitinophagaceae bacterium]